MPPKKWKMAILVWLAIYPTITFILFFFGPTINKISSLPIRTLVLTGVVVPIMVFILLPWLQKMFGGWLRK